MEDILQKSLGCNGYQDIRFEDLITTSIHFMGKHLDNISINRQRGGHARALLGGGWGTFSFSRDQDTPKALENALQATRLIPGTLELAPAPVIQDTIHVQTDSDPRPINVKEKKRLLEHYNNLALSHKDIHTTRAVYKEIFRKKHFCNNEGTEIYQEQLLVSIQMALVARRGNIIQRVGLSLGGSPHFSSLLGQEALLEEKIKEVRDLVQAEPAQAGHYTVILDPECTSVFVHEAFGHLSESDNLSNNRNLQKVMQLGREFGPAILNIVDDPTIPDVPGHFKYDDEGVEGTRNELIREGKLVGRLHSRETAAQLGEKITGNSRATDYTFPPVVRMTTTFIEGGPHTFEEMLAGIDEGLYLKEASGGQTSGEFFTFDTQLGYQIINGKLGPMIRDASLSGNLFTTLQNIQMIGDDMVISKSGGCGKANQLLYEVGMGSPHLKIQDMAIGGK